jgi:hypothetical protein
MDSSTVFFVAIVGGILFIMVTLVTTGSIIATVIIAMIVGVIIYVLTKLGYLTIDLGSDSTLNVGFHETAPAPASSAAKKSAPKNLEISEVFYVGGNEYIYDEASAVCAAYGAQLASYDQIATAFAAGAEWCGYGWTQGGMALFPTQEATWNDLQKDAVANKSCGRPGVNGGYFDPATKFGVNCYGVKPKDISHNKFPLPLPGTDTSGFNKMVNKFKSMLKHMPVNPFNRVGWSEWNAKSHEPSSIQSAVNDVQSYI